MKILLAPAETKLSGGNGKGFCKENFGFSILHDKRLKIFDIYEKHIQSCSLEELSEWFGLKNLSECERYSESLKNKPTMKAIQRYSGIAFEALGYNSLKQEDKEYIDKNVLMFSNLFGVLKASDLIPDYKYKQGAQLLNINIEKFYKEHLKDILDDYLREEVIDLRSEHYNKFYKISASTITYKFLKSGKVISHWAKYYRGLVLRSIAQNKINNFVELINMTLDGLKLKEIQEKENIKTLIMTIEG